MCASVCFFLREDNKTLLDIMLSCLQWKSFLSSFDFVLASATLAFVNVLSFQKSFQLLLLLFFLLLFFISHFTSWTNQITCFLIYYYDVVFFFFFGRVRGYNDMYSCILMAQVKKRQIIYISGMCWVQVGTGGWSQWASLLLFSFQSIYY